ncbi:MAG: hypothetical protein [Microviridae sp.]|nr:MAG: hypothetical protein [Microviridae sp.]
MQNSQTKLKHQAISNVSSEPDTDNKENSRLLTREPIEKTPFYIVGNDEIGWKITWGKYALSEIIEMRTEADRWLENNHWEATLQMIQIAFTVKFPETKDSK